MKFTVFANKLLFISICSTLITIPAIADSNVDSRKIAVMKEIYSFSVEDSDSDKENPLFTADLENVFQEDAICSKEEEGVCAIDYDVFIQGQDYDENEIKRTLTYQIEPNGNVKVTFTSFGKPITLYYVMQCDDNHCLIDDILEPSWTNPSQYASFKKTVRATLKEIKATKKP
jgi:hypothetical protein